MNARILIIDDDSKVVNYYAKALKEVAGLSVVVISSPSLALECIQQSEVNFDAVVFDIMMPLPESPLMKDSKAGLLTGASLGAILRQKHPTVLRFVLTNQRQSKLLEETNRLCCPKRIWNKVDFPPFDFAEELKRAISER